MTPTDRIAELKAELTEARAKLKEAHWRLNDADSALEDAGFKVIDERFDQAIQRLYSAFDAERAAHARTQAEAAALREWIRSCGHGCGSGNEYSHDVNCQGCKLLSGDTGRALAERVRRLEAVAKAASDHSKCCGSEDAAYARLIDTLGALAALDEK